MKMMPEYLKDIKNFPRFLFRTYDMYKEAAKNGFISQKDQEEISGDSGKIIYDLENGRNPYFLIKKES
jgi:hypothetical protein